MPLRGLRGVGETENGIGRGMCNPEGDQQRKEHVKKNKKVVASGRKRRW